jgi:hypothetical protein
MFRSADADQPHRLSGLPDQIRLPDSTRAADDGRVQAGGQPEDMKQRQAAHGHVVRAGVEHLGGREAGVAGQVRVREPLGLPVVPEVYKITASSSPASATESAGAIRPAARADRVCRPRVL